MSDLYPVEELDDEEDNGTMPDNVETLRSAVVGRRIVKAEKTKAGGMFGGMFVLTLDDGTEVRMADTDDCCACTYLDTFLLHPEMIDHVIMGVGTTEEYTRWHIYADLGDILELTVGWSCGNPFYYGYGFDIDVVPA